MRLPLARGKFATFVSAYAPTLTNPEETKNKFYEDLHVVIKAVHNADKLIILGDFNARVGRERRDQLPLLKEARDQGKIAYFNYDKLIIKESQRTEANLNVPRSTDGAPKRIQTRSQSSPNPS